MIKRIYLMSQSTENAKTAKWKTRELGLDTPAVDSTSDAFGRFALLYPFQGLNHEDRVASDDAHAHGVAVNRVRNHIR